jgi:uncharacterized delta-60 repeat protein
MGVARIPNDDYSAGDRTTLDFGAPSVAHALVGADWGLVAAGAAGGDFALAQLDGNLNAYRSDGTSRLARISFGAEAVARSVSIGAGGVLAAGGVRLGQGGSLALARYNLASDAPDASFGLGGKVVDDVSPGDDVAYAVTSERVVAGRAGPAALVARYNVDGSLDSSFGDGGHVLLDLTPLEDTAYGVLYDSGGAERRSGYLVAGAAGSSAFVARLLSDGTLDVTFGTNGVLRTTLGGLRARFTGIAFPTPSVSSQFLVSAVVARAGGEDARGAFDATFGTGGVALTDFGGTADFATTVSGSESRYALVGGDGADMIVTSYGPDGRLLRTKRVGFGTPADETVPDSVRLADGKTLVVATRWPGGLFLVRFLPDGTLDSSFGKGGLVDPGFGSSARAWAVNVGPDGRVLVAFEMSSYAFVARFLTTGGLDTSFGEAGLAALGQGAQMGGWQVVPLADGRILTGFGGGGVALLTASGALEAGFGDHGRSSVSSSSAVFLSDPNGVAIAVYGDPNYCHGVRAQRIESNGTTSFAWCGPLAMWPTAAVRAPDGRVIVAGTTDGGGSPARTSSDSMVAAILPSGSPDASFGAVGHVRLDLRPNEQGLRVAFGSSGTIVVVAQTRAAWDDSALSLARLLPNGRPDRSFGKGGAAHLRVRAAPAALGVQGDGKVVVTAELGGDNGRDVGLVRYTPGGTAVVTPRSWGWNAAATLGNGTKVDARSAVAPAGLTNVRGLAAGWYHSAAVLDDGSVWTWGWGGVGQLGTAQGTDSTVPVRVDSLPPAMAVAAGPYHTLALAIDGTVWAWGWNGLGQLGDGTTTSRGRPARVLMGGNVVGIAAGAGHSLALLDDGSVWAWGWNATGQLGDGTATDRLLPTQVYQASQVVEVAAGGLHSLAVRMDGTVAAWGWNGVGQLGAGQTGDAWIPYQVPGLTDVAHVATGLYHSLAAKRDGTVAAWGWNPVGQLGDGTTATQFAPVAVPGLTGVERVAGGTYHSLALKQDGTVWAWGWNGVGQLGDGTLTDRLTPVRSTQIVDATTISAASHSLAG